MRLLNTKKVFITEVYDIDALLYAILSHIWSAKDIILKHVQNSDTYGGPWSDTEERSSYSLVVSKSKGFGKIIQSVNLAAHEGYEDI
jgi:hypothetical protein